MRHGKHRFSLGCKKEHREALMANLASALFEHGKINTTLAKAKALRPFAEKMITQAVKAHVATDPAVKLHHRRLVIARIRNESAARELFDVKASEFVKRHGGYTRIYKLVPRIGDAAKMAIIELVYADDRGYAKSRRGKKKSGTTGRSQKSGPGKTGAVQTPAPAPDPVPVEAAAEAPVEQPASDGEA
jgi:large subunit ribosomal protein L17